MSLVAVAGAVVADQPVHVYRGGQATTDQWFSYIEMNRSSMMIITANSVSCIMCMRT